MRRWPIAAVPLESHRVFSLVKKHLAKKDFVSRHWLQFVFLVLLTYGHLGMTFVERFTYTRDSLHV
jgi:hypothetical protein